MQSPQFQTFGWRAYAIIAVLFIGAVVILRWANDGGDKEQTWSAAPTSDGMRVEERPTPTLEAARCSLDPTCKLTVTSEILRDLYRGSEWEVDRQEGLPGKFGYVAASDFRQVVVSWIDQQGVQLVSMLAPAPCTFDNRVHVERGLIDLLGQVIPQEHGNYGPEVYGAWCLLADRRSGGTDSRVLDGVVVQISYLPDLAALTLDMWPCGVRSASGLCQWRAP